MAALRSWLYTVAAVLFLTLLQSEAACPPTSLSSTDFEAVIQAITKGITTTKAGPGKNAVNIPTDAQRDSFVNTVVSILKAGGDSTAACSLPSSYKYLAMKDSRMGQVLIIAEVSVSKSTATAAPVKYWGTYAVNLSSVKRKLLVSVPHPVEDSTAVNSATLIASQGAAVFANTQASFFMMAGAHRCSMNTTSGCLGTTSACFGQELTYRISDAAYSVQLPFNAIHEGLIDPTNPTDPNFPFLQLHSNKNSNSKCPSLLFSDTSGRAYLSDSTWAGRLQTAYAAVVSGASATSAVRTYTSGRCGSKELYNEQSACDLCSEDSVLGKALAWNPSPCTGSASLSAKPAGYNRFIHIDQIDAVQNDPAAGDPLSGYGALVQAINNLMPLPSA